MCVATFMTSLDVTIVNVALPSLQTELHMNATDLEWVISAYTLSLAAVIPASGALGDRYGRKRVFLAGIIILTVGVLACALDWHAAALIAFRAVQGVGGAAMAALGLSIVTEAYPAEQRAGAIGAWAAIGGTGFGAGPVGGGILLTYFGWQSVFWVNVPFAALGILGTAVAFRESRNPHVGRLDSAVYMLCYGGMSGALLGTVGVRHGYQEAVSLAAICTLAAAVVGFAGFRQRRVATVQPGQPVARPAR